MLSRKKDFKLAIFILFAVDKKARVMCGFMIGNLRGEKIFWTVLKTKSREKEFVKLKLNLLT